MTQRIISSLIILSITVTSLLSGNVWAEISQEDVNTLSTPPGEDPYDTVEANIDNWFTSHSKIQGIEDNKGNLHYSAIDLVSVDPSNSSWVKARQIAFEKALLKAQANFIKDQFERVLSDTVSAVDRDDSSNNREFKDTQLDGKSRLSSVVDKLTTLADAQLDNLLAAKGINPTQFASMPPAERKNLATEEFIRKTFIEAIGQSSGLLPLKTFEGGDSETYAVGVIMVYSPRFKQLAYDMANGRDPGIGKKKGRPLDTWLNLKPEDLAHTFGIRLVVTPEGEPVILSYGQWGYSDQGSTANQKSRKKLAAAEQAESKATEQLVIFMNSTLSLSKESITGDFIEEYLLKQGDSTIEKNITTVIDKLSQQIKQTASANMGGTRTVKRWTYKHPFGHEIIGRVKMWSRQGYESAQAIKNFKPNRTGQDTGQASGKGTVGAHTGESPEFDDPEEFF